NGDEGHGDQIRAQPSARHAGTLPGRRARDRLRLSLSLKEFKPDCFTKPPVPGQDVAERRKNGALPNCATIWLARLHAWSTGRDKLVKMVGTRPPSRHSSNGFRVDDEKQASNELVKRVAQEPSSFPATFSDDLKRAELDSWRMIDSI